MENTLKSKAADAGCKDADWASGKTVTIGLNVENSKRKVVQGFPGLPWGWHFNPHTHPIPTGIPIGIPWESPYPRNPK